ARPRDGCGLGSRLGENGEDAQLPLLLRFASRARVRENWADAVDAADLDRLCAGARAGSVRARRREESAPASFPERVRDSHLLYLTRIARLLGLAVPFQHGGRDTQSRARRLERRAGDVPRSGVRPLRRTTATQR